MAFTVMVEILAQSKIHENIFDLKSFLIKYNKSPARKGLKNLTTKYVEICA